jgi:hypothetical protein
MRKAISVNKKWRGRPATGQDPAVSARLPQEVIDQVDAWAKKAKVTRSQAIRQLVMQALEKGGR